MEINSLILLLAFQLSNEINKVAWVDLIVNEIILFCRLNEVFPLAPQVLQGFILSDLLVSAIQSLQEASKEGNCSSCATMTLPTMNDSFLILLCLISIELY